MVEGQASPIAGNITGLYQALVESALDSVIIVDHRGLIVEFNPAAERTFGFERSQVIGQPLGQTIVPPALRQAHTDGFERYLQTRSSKILGQQIEITALHADGRQLAIELCIVSVETPGDPLFAAHIRDITARRQTETKYRKLFDSSNDGILLHYPDGPVIDANAKALDLLGYAKEQLRSIYQIYPDSFHAKIKQAIRTVSREGFVRLELPFLTRSGATFAGEISASHFDLDNREIIQVVMHDLTEREKIEQGLRENDRMKSEFVANVSHELRTPLASILGFTTTILDDAAMPPDLQREFLGIIRDESKRLAALIENLLDISRIEAGTSTYNLEPTNLSPLVRDRVNALTGRADGAGIQLQCSIEEQVPKILADPQAVVQLVDNLLGNAIKFTDTGGHIQVAVAGETDGARLEVSDTGMGIPAADLEKIFEKFYRVDKPGMEIQGTGLGLAIVKDIVEFHHGQIEVKSQPGKGSTFVIHLPCIEGAELRPTDASQAQTGV